MYKIILSRWEKLIVSEWLLQVANCKLAFTPNPVVDTEWILKFCLLKILFSSLVVATPRSEVVVMNRMTRIIDLLYPFDE